MARNDIANFDPTTGEIIEQTETVSLAQQLTKAEIDQQIATAHRFPRSRAVVARGILELATWSPEAAAECNYALPRGGKSLTGPSIRLAEIIAAEYGNCRVGARVVHVDRFEKYVEAEAIFHDLEKNTATTSRVRRRIVDSRGGVFSDDMIIVTGNAAASIAKRNAILQGVPKALWMPAYDAALKVIKGDAKTMTERRDAMLRALAAFGVTPDMVCGALEIGGPLEIGLDQIPTMIAWHKSLKEGDATVEDLFPAPAGGKDAKAAPAKGTAAKLDKIAQGAGAKAPAEGKQQDKGKANEQGGEAAGEGEGKAAGTERANDGPGDNADAPGGEEGSDGADGRDGDGEGEGQASGTDSAADDEALEAAFVRGEKARAQGRSRDAVPPDLRNAPALRDAWLRGWDDA
jgi:ribosome modulation factor